ncbi:MAG: FtsX-like permease family protein [Acidobacteriia bacterium]|nr:FtsX-like permease family protein [Terriglobia bacterium]
MIALAMAVSIAAITGVQGAADAARRALQGDSRAWLAADLCVDTREPILQEQADALDRMKRTGVDWTVMSTVLTTAASDQSADGGFIAVKAVDPSVFPFYGALELSPVQPLTAALRSDTAAVSEDVLERLQIRVGGTIQVAGQPFRVAALIKAEPDRFSDELGLGMRCILSREGYQRTGIERSANSVKHRILLRLGRGVDLAGARRQLQEIFPEGNLRDYRGAHRQQSAMTESAISFLSVTALLALMLGAIGVAIAVRQHARDRLADLAVMRILGARSPQMAFVFFAQIAWMVAAALAAGILLGFLARLLVLPLAGKYMVLPPGASWDIGPILESAAAALVAMLPVLVEPALLIRYLRPAIVLRQGSGEKTVPGPAAVRSAFGWTASGISFLALAALAYRMLRSWNSALLLVAALAASIAIAWWLTDAALRVLRRWTSQSLKSRAPLVCHGLAGLYRPGNHSRSLIVALAAALTVMIATFEAGSVVVQATLGALPFDPHSLYIAGVNESNRASLRTFVERQPGVQGFQIMTQARLELRTFRLRPPEHSQITATAHSGRDPVRQVPRDARRVRADGLCDAGYALDSFGGADACVPISFAGEQSIESDPSSGGIRRELVAASGRSNALNSDQWNYLYAQITGVPQIAVLFPAASRLQSMTVDYYLERRANAGLDNASYLAVCDNGAGSSGAGPARLIMAEDVAHKLGAQIGSRLEFVTRDRAIEARVAGIRKLSPAERFWSAFELDCSSLNPESLFHQAAVRIRPDRFNAVRRAILTEYPTLAVITPDDISETLRAVTNDAMTLVRVVAWFAIGAGLAVLIAAVAASRAARLSEIGIFSALGARRRTMLKIYSVEFAALGLVAGLIAGLLVCGFGSVVLSIVLGRAETIVDWKPITAAIVIAALLAAGAGWLPTYGLLERKTMEVLRGE